MRELHPHRIQSILCLGAHSDDIEIGCGGTILQWLRMRPDVRVHWVVFSAEGPRRDEALQSADAFLQACPDRRVEVHEFPDAYFPARWESIKDHFRQLRERCDPDLVFTHRLQDRHQDHRTVSELTWNHFRDHLILEYEIPKYEGDLATPSLYVPLQPEIASRKVELLRQQFATQRDKGWFDASTFEATMRIRGLEAGAETKWAEGFFARKLVLGWEPEPDRS